jgi:hypothetical protein
MLMDNAGHKCLGEVKDVEVGASHIGADMY